MDDWVTFVLAIMAVYRVANIISREGGPFNVFGKLRGWLYNTYEANRLLEKKVVGLWLTLHDFVTCPYCLGVWVGFFFGVLIYSNNRIADFIILGFGLAGGQALIQEIGDYLGREPTTD